MILCLVGLEIRWISKRLGEIEDSGEIDDRWSMMGGGEGMEIIFVG
jgi:hypothetical protein